MLSITIKSAWRQLRRNKGYSVINIVGLAVGLTVAILSGLWVNYHQQFDQFHADGERVFQLLQDYQPSQGAMQTDNALCIPLARLLKEEATGIEHIALTDWLHQEVLQVGDKKLRRTGLYVEPDFLNIFTFPLVSGDKATALQDPNQVLITTSVAQELFGTDDAVGKTIKINDIMELQVGGVLADIPAQSSWQFDYLKPFSLKLKSEPWLKAASEQWGNNSFQIVMKTTTVAAAEGVKAKYRDAYNTYDDDPATRVNMQSIQQQHLYTEFENGVSVSGLIRYVRLFGWVGVLILLIACVNFVNIATAMAEKRAKEVGVRKAIGAGRGVLVRQYLGEAGVTVAIAGVLALLLVQLTLPSFNILVEAELALPWTNTTTWVTYLGVLLLTTLLAGCYPAFFLTRYEAKDVLQRTHQLGRSGQQWSRRALVATQFAVCIALIAGSIIVHQQVRFALDRDSGYEREQLLNIPSTPGVYDNYDAIQAELLRSNAVKYVSTSHSPATEVWSTIDGMEWPGMPAELDAEFAMIGVSHDYFSAMGMEFVAGRPFRRESKGDSARLVFNEAAIAFMGLDNSLEQLIRWDDTDFQIAGIVKDVVMDSPFESVQPTFYLLRPEWQSVLLLRLNEEQALADNLAAIKTVFEKHDPATPFNYTFVAEDYAAKTSHTNFVGQVALLFAGLAVFLSVLGLFGLAVYLTERRAKEISIRKILGASVAQLWALLSREFVLVVLLGALIALPLGGYVLEDWLSSYTYRIELPWLVFGLAAGIALLISILTISVQSIKAALVNPADRLRDE